VAGGIFIGNVAEGSAAAKLGLLTGDYLLEMNGTKLPNLETLKPLIGGEVSTVLVWRNGKAIPLGGLSSF
jgi:S1-C subfamily serine protease